MEYDFVVLGSGIAGLTFALDVAAVGSVALITKKVRSDSNTNWAQGGIAGVMAPDDNFELHIDDTLIAGAGLCKREANCGSRAHWHMVNRVLLQALEQITLQHMITPLRSKVEIPRPAPPARAAKSVEVQS